MIVGDWFIIIRIVFLEDKNALIVSNQKDRSILIVESPPPHKKKQAGEKYSQLN